MNKSKLVIAYASMCLATAAGAQNFTGTVHYTDPGGASEPLPFAQVYYVEQESLLECDGDGRFEASVKPGATLIATYVGYTQDTVVVSEGMSAADFYLTGSNTLEEAVATARQSGLQRLSQIKTEAIGTSGIHKMACCNLAESFENTASVSVGYSDAITGARQIKLLGLSGVYTQMQDEKIPVMRALSSTFGFNYVPGQWLESIYIAKGPSSVANDAGGISGQINLEHRKPTAETPLFVNLYGSSDNMYDATVGSALQITDRLSTVLMTYASNSNSMMDHNGDGFRDDPKSRQLNLANRWLYLSPKGVEVRAGFKVVDDNRLGGQMSFTRDMASEQTPSAWGSLINNRLYNAFVKVGVPLNRDMTKSIAVIGSLNRYTSDAGFGVNTYDGTQTSRFINLIYHSDYGEHHSLELALTHTADIVNEDYERRAYGLDIEAEPLIMRRSELETGVMGEYTYKNDKFTVVAGTRLTYNHYYRRLLPVPRLSLKYSVTPELVVRGSAGLATHSPYVFADNYGVFSSNRKISYIEHDPCQNTGLSMDLEIAGTYGGNITWYLPFGEEDASYLSLEYFRTDFSRQLYADMEWDANTTMFYMTKSATQTVQADFSADINEHFNAMLTFRYTDPKVQKMEMQGDVQQKRSVVRPMSGLYKGLVNLQYKSNMSRWTVDFTAQINGPMRLPEFAARAWDMEYSPVYPMLYLQVTRKFPGLDVYGGVENITDFRQKDAIVGADDPFGAGFDASAIWGPLMGRKFYLGLRYTLWK